MMYRKIDGQNYTYSCKVAYILFTLCVAVHAELTLPNLPAPPRRLSGPALDQFCCYHRMKVKRKFAIMKSPVKL